MPSHSHTFGGWLEARIMDALFWFIIFLIAVRNLVSIRMPAVHRGMWAVFIFSTVMLIWASLEGRTVSLSG